MLKNSDNQKGKTFSAELTKVDDREKKFLKIWKVNPTYKDIEKKETLLKTGSLTILGFLFFSCALYVTRSLVLSIIITSIIVISYVAVFHKSVFS